MPKQTNRTAVATVLSGALMSLPAAAFHAQSELLGCVGLVVWGFVVVIWLFKDGK